MNSQRSLRIPIADSSDFVEIYPDELPSDVNDLLDVLKAEYAPLKIWRAAAVEYYRQGQLQNFESVLNEIISTMDNKDIDEEYRKKGEYKEGVVEIFDAMAAYALYKGQNEDSGDTHNRKEEIMGHIKKSQAVAALNEYTWIIRGFYELYYGNMDHAEFCLKQVYDKASTVRSGKADKRIYLHGSLLGLGAVAYTKEKYSVALDFFVKAVHHNPRCGANVRVAIATCAFKLGQYDRCRAAVDRALALDPSNVDALVLLALLERMESQRSGSTQRHERRATAHQLCLLASKIDPTCSMALNHVANHSFHMWNRIDTQAEVVSVNQVKVGVDTAAGGPAEVVQIGDILQIKKTHIFPVSAVVREEANDEVGRSIITFTVTADIPTEWIGQRVLVEAKEAAKINEVNSLATVALRTTNVLKIRAESFYILGRLYHMLRDFDIALQLYEQALNCNPKMPLALYGAAQLHLGREDFGASLEKFEEVLLQYPDDRDAQAYEMLLKSIHKKEHATFDKLREVAPGFAFEADLWLSQGDTMQSKGPGEYPSALKCFEMALECMEKQGLCPHRQVFLNMGVLYHSLGNLKAAKKFICHSLSAPSHSGEAGEVNPIFRRPENDIFYSWSDTICEVEAFLPDGRVSSGTRFGECFLRLSSCDLCPSSTLCSTLFSVDDDILVGDFVVRVMSVLEHWVHCTGMVCVPLGCTWEARKKIPGSNFNKDTITNCFDLARVQEDLGDLQAAREIYIELLKKHPSYIECYLRLSLMASDIGRREEASHWVKQALVIDPQCADAVIVEADLHAMETKWDLAKAGYERILKNRRHDERTLVSQGNLYFANSGSRVSLVKDSMKFYHSVLREHPKNVYAANGLGLICAEKGENDVAREIFSRAREAGMQSSHDICVNLGHIYMRQNRVVDAGILYQASLKSLPASPSVAMQSENIVAVSDCLALSHFRHQQYDDAARTLLKALHYNPTKLHDWYNIAYVKEELAVKLCRQNKSASDIAHAIDEMEYAVLIFRSLRDQSLCCGMTQHERFQASKVEDHEKFCLDNIEKAKLHMNRVQFEEQRSQELRAQQQREHLQRLALRNEEKQKDMERKRQARAEQQEVARQKQKEFELLKESWTSAAQASERKGKKKKSKPEFSDAAEDGLDNEGEPALYESDSDGDMEANSKHSNIQSGNGSGLEGDGDNVEDSASPRDIFGSDSEEELFLKSSSSTTAAQKRTSSLRENDSDDDDIDDVDSSSHRPPPVKQRRVVDDDDDDVD